MPFELIAATVWVAVPLLAFLLGVVAIAATRRRLDAAGAAGHAARVRAAVPAPETASSATAA